MFTMPAELHL